MGQKTIIRLCNRVFCSTTTSGVYARHEAHCPEGYSFGIHDYWWQLHVVADSVVHRDYQRQRDSCVLSLSLCARNVVIEAAYPVRSAAGMRPAMEGQAARQRLTLMRSTAGKGVATHHDLDGGGALSPQAPCRFAPGDVGAAGGVGQRCFPPSVFPLWKPPFLIPPFKKELTKGGKPQGAPARRNYGADGGMEPLSLHALHGLRQAQALPSAPRRPTGCRRHSAAHPPLRHGPRRAGRFGRPGSGCGRSGPRTVSALHGTAAGTAIFSDAVKRRLLSSQAARTTRISLRRFVEAAASR